MVAAHGEMNLRMAGRVADSVITGYGLLPHMVQRSIDLVHEGATEAGRDPSTIDIWYLITVVPGETLEAAFANTNVMAGAKRFVDSGEADTDLPPQVKAAYRELGGSYDLAKHSRTNVEAAQVCAKHGAIDYLVARAGGMVGPVDYTKEVERLRSYGCKNLILVGMSPDKASIIDAVAAGTVAKRTAHARPS